jgi:glutamate transport system substrate-binding protein
MAEIVEAGTLKVGTKFDQPLFGLKNLEGEPEGFDVEVAKLIGAKLGLSEDAIEFTETVSANREPFLEQGRVDMVVATYTINDKRDMVVDFAGPTSRPARTSWSPRATRGHPGRGRPRGKKVCSVAGSTPAATIAENVPEAELVEFDAYTKCRDALRNGQVDAVTTDNVILSGYVSEAPDDFELVGKPFTKEPVRHRHPRGPGGLLRLHQRDAEGGRGGRQLRRGLRVHGR